MQAGFDCVFPNTGDQITVPVDSWPAKQVLPCLWPCGPKRDTLPVHLLIHSIFQLILVMQQCYVGLEELNPAMAFVFACRSKNCSIYNNKIMIWLSGQLKPKYSFCSWYYPVILTFQAQKHLAISHSRWWILLAIHSFVLNILVQFSKVMPRVLVWGEIKKYLAPHWRLWPMNLPFPISFSVVCVFLALN